MPTGPTYVDAFYAIGKKPGAGNALDTEMCVWGRDEDGERLRLGKILWEGGWIGDEDLGGS